MTVSDNERGPVTPAATGWECPRCHQVYAPHIVKCFTCPRRSLRERLDDAMPKPVRLGSPPREGDIR